MGKTNIKDLSNDEACMILTLFYISEASKEAYALWDEFGKEIKNSNRFFPKAKILNYINSLGSDAEITIKSGTLLYRARTFVSSFLDYEENREINKKLLKYIQLNYPSININKASDIYRYIKMDYTMALDPGILDVLKDYAKEKKQFWGYNEKDSDAPPVESVKPGRANPNGIRVLYLAENEKTAIYEVRPSLNQHVSVAEFELIKDLKIFDFCKNIFLKSSDNTPFLLQMLSKLFSEVNQEKEEDYLPTQYICAYIRELGFDGVRFASSLNSDGKNIVLFDANVKNQNYRIVKSTVYNISKYDIRYQQILPLEIPSN